MIRLSQLVNDDDHVVAKEVDDDDKSSLISIWMLVVSLVKGFNLLAC